MFIELFKLGSLFGLGDKLFLILVFFIIFVLFKLCFFDKLEYVKFIIFLILFLKRWIIKRKLNIFLLLLKEFLFGFNEFFFLE